MYNIVMSGKRILNEQTAIHGVQKDMRYKMQ